MEAGLAHYTCYRTAGPIEIDGKLDEPSWRMAPKSAPFVDIVTGEPAWFDTRVALLWDDDCLYFGFTAEEPEVRGYLTERDSRIYEEQRPGSSSCVEPGRLLRIRDQCPQHRLRGVLDMEETSLLPQSPYFGRPEFDPAVQRTMVLDGVGGHVHPRGERWGFLDWDFPGLRHAVHVAPPGWSAELALPWRGLRDLADGRALPPRHGDVWRIDCSRFQQFDRAGRKLDTCATSWTWNRHGHYDSHIPETFTYVEFSSAQVAAGAA